MTKATNVEPPSTKRPAVKACHICGSVRFYYLLSTSDYRMVRCDDCGLLFLNPQPSDEELAKIYTANYFLASDNDAAGRAISEIKLATAGIYLSEIRRYHGPETGRLLEIGCGRGDFLELAENAGWHVTGVEYSSAACEAARLRLKKGEVLCGELKAANLPGDQFDLCVISDVLEHIRSPLEFLREIHRLLKPGATLFVATPSIDSWSARFLRQKWMEFKAEHVAYFDRQTLQTALFKTGFREIILQPGWKILNFDYIQRHFARFPVPFITPLLNLSRRLLPRRLQLRQQRIVASGIMAFARKAELRPLPVLSVIVPAFNEAKTFSTLMDSLLHKELPGVQMEIVVVESNSTDGTREVVRKYQDVPGVKLIFEDQPRGKGHAVRTGLQAATGDYVLIQDADLEYDLEDYDVLLEQLLAGRSAFVLGSRHGGRNVLKMRQFTGQYFLSLFFNLGHWTFTTLINLLFWQRLRDPFTMFKVFRRDCLAGLVLECNRFDFDHELVVKLIRKGYRPIELPVNYRSRSYKEGKKVRVLLDPLQWLRVLLWLRFVKIDPMAQIEQSRMAQKGQVAPKAIAP
jgi:2-polyprenyl-3-methyl-5-hydroxy-6-metoxy-1,4-benzoquinol methylase